MFYLFLSVACSVLIGFLFKLFPKYGIDTLQAIVFNYFTCVAVGGMLLGDFPVGARQVAAPWWPYALFLGLVFISGFNSAALTVRHFSVTLSQIMQKMSILLTVPFAILAYQESSGVLKVVGIVLALGAIILVNWPQRRLQGISEGEGAGRQRMWIPVLTWVLAGVIEITFIRVEGENMLSPGDPAFITTIFGTAGVLGLLVAAVGWIRGSRRWLWRNVWAGILLGIPNFGSMHFLLLALGDDMEGSLVFPLANVSIILFTTIGAVWLFQEKLSRLNWAGIALALAAISFISL